MTFSETMDKPAHCELWRHVLNSSAVSQIGSLMQFTHTFCDEASFQFDDCLVDIEKEKLCVPKLLMPLLQDKRLKLYQSICCLPAKENIFKCGYCPTFDKDFCNLKNKTKCNFHKDQIQYYAITLKDISFWGVKDMQNQLPLEIVEKILHQLDEVTLDSVFNLLKLKCNSTAHAAR